MEKNKLKKIFAGLVMLCLTTSAFTIPKGPKMKNSHDNCKKTEEIAPGPFAFAYPKDLSLCAPNDFYFFGEFLLMQVKQDGMEYGMTQSTFGTNTNADIFPLTGAEVQGHSTGSHHYRWNYGCRVGCGFYLNHDAWNVEAQWTYVRFKEDTGKNVQNSELLNFWLPPALRPRSHTNLGISERWTGNLNTFDLTIGKPYHVSRFVVLNPFFGLRAAWIEQDITARNGGSYSNAAGTGGTLDTNIDMRGKNDFWAVGARAGMKSEWEIGAGFSLFGNLAASILFSHFDIDQKIIFNSATFVDLENDFYTNTPNVEVSLGLGWATKFAKDKYKVGLKGLYEFHHWWNMNRLRRFYDTTAPSANQEVKGDLMVSGFSFAIQFDF